MLALCWFYAGFMLAYVGSSWVKLAHVGSSWPKLASRCVYVGSKSRKKITGTHLPRPPKGQISLIFDPKLVILEHPESSKYWKKHVFYRSVCNLHFFVALNAYLGLQFGSSSLQVGSCWLTWTKLSPSWTKLAPTWLKMRQFCPKLASQKKRFWVRKKPVGSKLAPNLHLKGQGASPRGCTHPLA